MPKNNNIAIPPEQLYGTLLADVQLAQIFQDGKTFVDAVPLHPPQEICVRYKQERETAGFDLERFVQRHFQLPKLHPLVEARPQKDSIDNYIRQLWPKLQRTASAPQMGTLIPLPYPYIVPGGRFEECFYWDSYFTMLGLAADQDQQRIEEHIANFAYLIEQFGFVPNGNRTYFLSRSQPPFFALMLDLLDWPLHQIAIRYLPVLQQEYQFWMRGEQGCLVPGRSYQRSVCLEKEVVLNRYFDNADTPRAEMYAADVHLAQQSKQPNDIVYRHIRAACESGWDFSTRWLGDGHHFDTICTTDIIPVDLNSLLYYHEQQLARLYMAIGESATAKTYTARAEHRQYYLNKYCWDETLGFYRDYNYRRETFTPTLSLAAAFPLYVRLASPQQVKRVEAFLAEHFLRKGGLVSTLTKSGQQWDAPNGWAPLQWISIEGLRKNNLHQLADTVSERWIATNEYIYAVTGKIVEKYNVEQPGQLATGGEYNLQEGFGWSNGVLLQLLQY